MGCGTSKSREEFQPSRAVRVDAQTSPGAPATPSGQEHATEDPLAGHARKTSTQSPKIGNPGFYGLHPMESGKASGQEDSIKAALTRRLSPELDLEASTSDGASLGGSNINTFDSLSQFESQGMTNNFATTFRRPNLPLHMDPPIEAVSIASQARSSGSKTSCGGRVGGSAAVPGSSHASLTGHRRAQAEDLEHKTEGLSPASSAGGNPKDREERRRREPGKGSQQTATPPEIGNYMEPKPGGVSTTRKGKKSWSSVQLSGDEMVATARSKTPDPRGRRKPHAQNPNREAGGGSTSKPSTVQEASARAPSKQSRTLHPVSVEPNASLENDASISDSIWRTRRGRITTAVQAAETTKYPRQEQRLCSKSLDTKKQTFPTMQLGFGAAEQQGKLERKSPGSMPSPHLWPDAQNPFAELVDTQASSLDQLLTPASMNKPTLTTVIGNPLASNGSLTEEDMQQIEQYVQQQSAEQGSSNAQMPIAGSNAGGWPPISTSGPSAQQWRSMVEAAPTHILNSDAASDAAILGSILNTVTDTGMESASCLFHSAADAGSGSVAMLPCSRCCKC